MNLAELAAASGYGKSTINNFENGRTDASDEFLKKVAGVLNVTVGEILKTRPVVSVGPAATDPIRSAFRDEAPSWQHELVSRLTTLPESRMRRALVAFHSVLDALHEPPASRHPEVRYTAPPKPQPASSAPGTDNGRTTEQRMNKSPTPRP